MVIRGSLYSYFMSCNEGAERRINTMAGTVVIGLDGASWDLIAPWIEYGILPNLKYLKENGTWGYMQSQLPPVTCPNWKCYSTGKNPGKLGVFWWEIVDTKNRKIMIPNSESFHGKEIFDYINERGLKVGVINMPTTYPPKEIKGFLVAGGPDCVENDYTFPPNLQSYLEQKYHYRVHPPYPIYTNQATHKEVEAILQLIDTRFQVAKDFLNQVDFLHMTVFYINVLQHFFYQDKPVEIAWKRIDQRLGEFLEEDLNLILVSDHGSSEIDIVFNINTWLESEGYLTIKENSGMILSKLGIHKEKLNRFVHRWELKKILKKITPEWIISAIPFSDGVFSKRAKGDKLDWDTSKVIASNQGPVYLTMSKTDSQYEPLREELIEKLGNLIYPNTGKKIFKKVWKCEEIYSSEFSEFAPDLLLEQADGVFIDGNIGRKTIFNQPRKWKAENIRNGIFLAHGQAIKKGFQIDTCQIVDIAPTILHWINIAIPEDMDGRVLMELFDPNSNPAQRQIQYRQVSEHKQSPEKQNQDAEIEIRKRLEGLGYLS